MISGEQRGAVTVLTLEHGKANTIDTELCRGLASALDELVRDGSRAVVLTGTGRIFSAGVDLFRVVQVGAEYLADFLPALEEMLRSVIRFPRPLVAAINGHAIAGGCVLACGCDRRLVAGPDGEGRTGRLGIPELAVGVPFPTTPLEVMRTTLSDAAFRDLMYSGRTVEPMEAVDLGLADRQVDPGELIDAACAEAEALAGIASDAFALTKRQYWGPAEARLATVGDAWNEEVAELWSRDSTHEAIRRYLEKTVGKKG